MSLFKILLIPLLVSLASNANAATLQQCKQSLTLTVLQNLNFGTFVVNGQGNVTITPQGVRTGSNNIV